MISLRSIAQRATYVLLLWCGTCAASATPDVPLQPSVVLEPDAYGVWLSERNAEWRAAFDASAPSCKAFIQAEVPAASGAWCRRSLGYAERAIAATPDLLLVAATQRDGLRSGLGSLHELVNHPDALKLDLSGRSFRNEVFQIVGNAMHQSILRADAIDGMIGDLTQLCVRLDRVAAGGGSELAYGEVNEHATLACIRATAILELERYGAPRMVEPSPRQWPDADLQRALGANLFAVQQRALRHHQLLDGLVATSSLLVMQDFVSGMLQPCYRFIHRFEELGCAIP